MDDDLDEQYMRLALRLALKGAGRTSPNPMVGAVLVRKGKIIATGYHRRAGSDHGEIVALKQAGARARGATLYINLEPCDHYGRTPPCTLSLIPSGVKRVVAGMVDPDPRVSGKGIRRLRQAGIQVDVGLLEEESLRLNEAYIKYITRRSPFIILKLAASLDGKIATRAGDSRWVTGPAARRSVHRLRDRVDAVLVGVGTVIADNPRLTCRLPRGRNPSRVILDAHLRIPLSARLLHQRDPGKTIVVTSPRAPRKKLRAVERSGAKIWSFPARKGVIPFPPVLRRLGRLGCLSVMIEGGTVTATRALRDRVVDKILVFYAPKIVGGDGRDMFEMLGITKMSRARRIKEMAAERFGEDILISAYL